MSVFSRTDRKHGDTERENVNCIGSTGLLEMFLPIELNIAYGASLTFLNLSA